MKNIDKGAVVRTIVLFLALVNQSLVLSGYSPLPIDDEGIEHFVTGAFTFGAAIWAWWENNNITREARRKAALIEREEQMK
jgi:SPP1 family holin